MTLDSVSLCTLINALYFQQRQCLKDMQLNNFTVLNALLNVNITRHQSLQALGERNYMPFTASSSKTS